MPEQELNLLQFTTAVVAQLRTGPAEVVWRDMLQTRSLAAASDHIPHNVLRDATSPHLPLPCHRSEDSALCDVRRVCPVVEGSFDPVRNGYGANVATFANQIHHGPVSLAHLDVVQLQTDQFRSAKPAAKQHGQHRIIALGAHAVAASVFEHL